MQQGFEQFDIDDLYARLLSGATISLDERSWLVACASLWVMTTEAERTAYLDRYMAAVGPGTVPSIMRH